MKARKFLAAALILSAGVASAQPYGWVFGSSQDSTESGNRVVVVDLNGPAPAVVGGAQFEEGWIFTDEPAGADPLVPTFSPDGSVIYMLVGGVFSPTPGDPLLDAHIYVYPTQTVIDKLAQQQSPGMADMLQPKISIEVPNDSTSPMEPTGLALSIDGTKLVMTEATYDAVYVWDVNPDGTIDVASQTQIDVVDDPSPPWINNAGTRAYLTTQLFIDGGRQDDRPSRLKIIDLTAATPAVMGEIDVPQPPQGPDTFGINTFPFASCAFPMAAGTSYTAFHPPGVTFVDDSVLYIYSGYVGFTGTVGFPPISTSFTLSDPFRVYAFDTTTEVLLNGGDPIYDETELPEANNQVIFSPLVHRFINDGDAQPYTHAGGSFLVYPGATDPPTFDRLFPDSSQLALVYGLMPENNDNFFIGSMAGIDGNEFAQSGDLSFLNQDAKIFKYPVATNGKANVTLTPIATYDRAVVLPLGFANSRLVVGASDGLYVVPVGLDQNATVQTDTIISLVDYTAETKQDITLGIVAGSYGQQPSTGSQSTPTPSPTPQATATITATPTATPDATATASPTVTPTVTPTATPQATATETPQPTATETPVLTATATPESTATATPQPTTTATPEPTVTPSPSPTPPPHSVDFVAQQLLLQNPTQRPDGNLDGIFDAADLIAILIGL